MQGDRAKAKNRFDPVIPNVRDWPIYKISTRRFELIQEVIEEAKLKVISEFPTDAILQDELARTLSQERVRITQKPWKADPTDEKNYWNNIRKALLKLPIPENEKAPPTDHSLEILHSIISRYANEIAGNFDPSVYEFAKRAIPFGFSRLLSSNFFKRLKERYSVRDRVKILGEFDTLRELAKTQTIIYVPTHSSNLDSIVVGWAVQELGLPAPIYGAGLNLFSGRILAYFMNRLGAYKVDRRKKSPIYLETLKTYSTLAIHKGVHSLFFPGGTRSRSGNVEAKLKLGLLGTALEAQYLNFLRTDAPNHRKIIVVPVVLNYHYVPEAPGLIEEFLTSTGEGLYLKQNDRLSSSFRIIRTLTAFLMRSSEIYLSFGQPVDLFGNHVDRFGDSIGKDGKVLDIRKYFVSRGKLSYDAQRGEEYIKRLGDIIVNDFSKYNVIFSSHIIAFTAFEYIRKQNKKLDFFDLLRVSEEDREISADEFLRACERVCNKLKERSLDRKLILAEHAQKADVREIIEHGLKFLGAYHDPRPLLRNKAGNIFTPNMRLLFFYHNRLEGYRLEQYV